MSSPTFTAMSQVAERPLRADARRNRERVIAAARAVFAEQGRDAPMDDVARRAEVGVGTVYRHFPTKEALLRAVAEDAFARISAVAGAQDELRERVEKIVRRAQEAGMLRADLVADDIGMLMCGIGSATMKPHRCHDAWRRHVAIVIDGLRASAASAELPH